MAASDAKELGVTPPSAPVPSAGSPRFTWRYEHQIDSQGRASLPSKWRPESTTTTASFMAVMIKHPSEAEFVMVLPMDQFDRFINPICDGDFTSPLKLAERHDYVDRIIELELDSNGRINLPKEMRAAAQLKSDVLFVGCINRFELWNPKSYETARLSEHLLKKIQNPEKT